MLNVSFTPFPELITARLLLRQVEISDAPEMFLLRSDEGLMKYICRPRPVSVGEAIPFVEKVRGMIAANEGVAWAITLKDSPKLIGHISFHILYKEHHRAEVGYMIFAEYQRMGITSEALQAVLQYGFLQMGLHSVEAHVNPDNTPSRNLLLKTGFVQEAYFKENFLWEGVFRDSVVYSLINPHKDILP